MKKMSAFVSFGVGVIAASLMVSPHARAEKLGEKVEDLAVDEYIGEKPDLKAKVTLIEFWSTT